MKYAVIDETLNLLHQWIAPAPRESVEQFVSCISSLYETCPVPLGRIAISLAGAVNPQNGYILACCALYSKSCGQTRNTPG